MAVQVSQSPATVTPERATRLAVEGVIRESSSAELARLLQFGADPNGRLQPGMPSSTLLHLLFKKKGTEWGRLGVETRRTREEVNSAPRRSNRLMSMQVLLDAGADATLVDEFGLSALHFACADCDARCAALLLKAGADVNLLDRKFVGNSGRPLHHAIWTLTNADVPADDGQQFEVDSNWAPASEESAELFQVLHAHGADWSLEDHKQRRPAELLSPTKDATVAVRDERFELQFAYRSLVLHYDGELLRERQLAAKARTLVLVAALRGRREKVTTSCGLRALGLLPLEATMSIFAFACPDLGLYSRWLVGWTEWNHFRKLALALAADEHRLVALQSKLASEEGLPDELITEMGEMDNRVQEAHKVRWTTAHTKAGAQAKRDLLKSAERVADLLAACGFHDGSNSDSEFVYESD